MECGFPAYHLRRRTDAPGERGGDPVAMQTSYGVVWREGDSGLAAGKLELLPLGIRLEGLEGAREIPYEGLAGVHIGRLAAERIDGRPSVVLEQRSGPPVTIATVARPSLVGEIVERLAAVQLGKEAAMRVAIVLPIKRESHDSVRTLLDGGPPFDPTEIAGLERHQVFLTAEEAIFVFDSPLGQEALEPLVADPDLWRAAAAWREHIAGPPRIAEEAFSWVRPQGLEELSSLPTPGPGDSDGGDIF